ncbi:AAA family ATPase [Thioflexithrix psekupsensis]|uniref:DUF3696 domain-containing protein n=1 Tax=Thioflexithrix psekupsensis TaxID=1570016 RepID=A0A251X820_9GAMM|nr:DUF3696 domain-containing protein [Thioflexithrix psekupsensis]OUD13934.1 hypothetical protein TPSD3_06210 [Thioflexithrix psekupsensis]
MINHLELDGFKSFVLDNIEFGTLTLLTGLNSCGKSSVIQALLMLEKMAKQQEYLLDGHGDIQELKNPYCQYMEVTAETTEGCVFKIPLSEPNNNPRDFPKLIYISADRFGSELFLPIFSGNNFDLGRKGENIFKCIDENSELILPESMQHPFSKGETFGHNVEAWLKLVSPNVKFNYQLQRLSDSSFATFNGFRAKNVGFGLSYTLPVIVTLLLASVKPNCMIMIENPEAHLHPRGQTEIAKLIALSAEAAKEINTQILIETHSDHLFDAIRIYAKNSKKDFHKLLRVYWFELNNQSNTEIEKINIDENGRMDNCPQGFFDQFEINARKLL